MPVSWNAGTYYSQNNIVLYVPNGLSYIASALSPNYNKIPPSSPTYWTLYTGGGGGGSISLISGGANINVVGGAGPTATISVADPLVDTTIQTGTLTASGTINTNTYQARLTGEDMFVQNQGNGVITFGGAGGIIAEAGNNEPAILRSATNGSVNVNGTGGIVLTTANTQNVDVNAPYMNFFYNSAINLQQLLLGDGGVIAEGHLDMYSSATGNVYNVYHLTNDDCVPFNGTYPVVSSDITINSANGIYLGGANRYIGNCVDNADLIGVYNAFKYPNNPTNFNGNNTGGIAYGTFKQRGIIPDNSSSMPLGAIRVIKNSLKIDTTDSFLNVVNSFDGDFDITQMDEGINVFRINVSIVWRADTLTTLGIYASLVINGTEYLTDVYSDANPFTFPLVQSNTFSDTIGTISFSDYVYLPDPIFISTSGENACKANINIYAINNYPSSTNINSITNGFTYRGSCEATMMYPNP